MATDYELWATQHGMADAQLVQVLEFQNGAWGSAWVCDSGPPFSGTTEGAVAFTADPVAFTIELPTSNPTTQQSMVIKMDALGGTIMAKIRAMTDAQRANPITVIYRAYLDKDFAAPAVAPLSFVVLSISGTRLVVQMDCAATVLPNIAAGIRYTIDQFPTMAYL